NGVGPALLAPCIAPAGRQKSAEHAERGEQRADRLYNVLKRLAEILLRLSAGNVDGNQRKRRERKQEVAIGRRYSDRHGQHSDEDGATRSWKRCTSYPVLAVWVRRFRVAIAPGLAPARPGSRQAFHH